MCTLSLQEGKEVQGNLIVCGLFVPVKKKKFSSIFYTEKASCFFFLEMLKSSDLCKHSSETVLH